VVLTVGKGLRILAAVDPEIDAAVKEALQAGDTAYYEHVAYTAMPLL
jgi:hypothetical protein